MSILGAGSVHVRDKTIHNILVIAEKHEMGPCLEGVLRDQGYHVTTEDSFVSGGAGRDNVDLIIATNTSLTPRQIHTMIPEIRSQHPNARILVLSGYSDDAWLSDLKQQGIDGIVDLPFQRAVLLQGVAGLLSGQIS